MVKSNPEWNEWEKIIYHEAGHAAMALCLWKEAAPLVLRRKKDKNGGILKEGGYKIKTGIVLRDPGDPSAPDPKNKSGLEQVMVLAAGAMIERLMYGQEGDGCTGDFLKIKTHAVHHNDQDALDEIKNDFPQSLQKTREIIDLIEKIASDAIDVFWDRDLLRSDFCEIVIMEQETIANISKSI